MRLGGVKCIGTLIYYKESQNQDLQKISTSIEDLEKIYKPYIQKFSKEELIEFVKSIDSMIIWMSERYQNKDDIANIIFELISWEVGQKFFEVDKYIEQSVAEARVFKEIKDLKLQDENLVKVDSQFQLENHGIIYDKSHLIYYHPLLRRHFTSNFTIGILLKKVAEMNDIELQIAIDQYRMTKPEYLKNLVEMDYWYGPHFSAEKLNNRNFIGVTVHKRIDKPISLIRKIDRTVFYMSNKKDGQKQIEIEEINPDMDKACSDKYVVQKYAHLIWDNTQHSFSHFDCSVRVYLKAEHDKRLLYDWKPKSISQEAQTVQRLKLFRLDGNIQIDLAMSLLGDFFRYNRKDFLEACFGGFSRSMLFA